MRNLTLLNEKRHKIHNDGAHEQTSNDCWIHFIKNPLIEESLASFAQDERSAIYYFALVSTGEVIAINSSGLITWRTNLSIFNGDESTNTSTIALAKSEWFSLTYADKAEHLVALSHGGSIATIDCIDGKTEIVGSFDFGLISGCWSSDSDFLCLITHQSTNHNERIDSSGEVATGVDLLGPIVIIMNSQFEILVETNLPISLSSEPIFIAWKLADNSLIAVSSVDKEDRIRRIRIFDVTTLSIVVMARSEDGSGKLLSNMLSCPIAWAGPNCSSLLAAIQKRGRHGLDVVFIESNGLQHGSFKLRTNEGDQVENINWSSESDLLAVVIVNVHSIDNSRRYKYQLYHRSNYHWYLKREVQYNHAIYPAKIAFDGSKKITLLASIYHRDSNEFECREYDFTWNFSASENGNVVVIDGSSQNVTHLNKAVIPPPMFAYSLGFKESISEVKFMPSHLWEKNRLGRSTTIVNAIASSCSGSILFIGYHTRQNQDNMMGGDLSLLAVYECSDDSIIKSQSSCLRQFTVFDVLYSQNDIVIVKLVALACTASYSGSWQPCDELFVMTFRMDFGIHAEKKTTVVKAYLDHRKIYQLPGQGIAFSPWTYYYKPFETTSELFKSPISMLVQLSDGCVYEYFSDSEDIESLLPISQSDLMFLEPCPTFSGVRSHIGQRVLIGISNRSRLYMGEKLIHEAVSSFYVSPAHGLLAFSTLGSRSQLYFIPISSLFDFDPLSSLEDSSLLEGYGCRELERGSALISLFPGRPEAVCLLPRGNLELLSPRALLIPFVVRLLYEEQYADAFLIIRRQKIDVNLLCDVNPYMFLTQGGIQKFLEQVQNVDHINLFIAGLSNSDVTVTKYPILDWFGLKTKSHDTTLDFSTKINQICSKMRSVMTAANECGTLNSRRIAPGELLLPILSTYAKEEPPQLEKALSLIKCGGDLPNHDAHKTVLSNDKVQNAITYLAFLSNYEILFDTALGMYDFDMAKAVARNSQLDPKQYLPLLKHYKEIPKYKARYEVDLRLRRYESALRHMVLDHEETFPKAIHDHTLFTECLDFIKKYKLHLLALELFHRDHRKKREVMLSLGSMMLQEGKYENALSIFLSTDPIEYPSVLMAARKGHDWKSYFTYHKLMTNEFVTERHPDVKDVAFTVAKEISEVALDQRRSAHAEAARILLDYGDDAYNAIGFLISGELWLEARRLCVRHGLEELRIKVIDEARLSAENYIIELEEKKVEFKRALEKFFTAKNVRHESKRKEMISRLESHGLDETESLFSLASQTSNVSLRSNMSNMSSFSRSSMSSVISAGHVSTFSIIESRSAVNPPKAGKKKHRKPKSKAEKRKIEAGSDEELINIMKIIKACVTDDLYAAAIAETVKFLLQERLSTLAFTLFQAYSTFKLQVNDCIKSSLCELIEIEEYRDVDPIIVSYEAELKVLKCADLPQHLQETFTYLNTF